MRGSSHEAPMSAPESPTLVNRKAIFALGRGDAQVAGGGDHRAGAGDHAVERADDRAPAVEHGQDQVAGRAREGEQAADSRARTAGR